jgi:hypothetical protein
MASFLPYYERNPRKRKKQNKRRLVMGLRGYLLLQLRDELEQKDFVDVVRMLEEMPDVDMVDPVVGGDYDVVVLVDSPITVESTAKKIREQNWVKDMDIVRIVSLFERHRTSKKELLQGLPHSGLNNL